nr:HAD family hydrolase [Dactylosporangium roseum]
MSAADPGITLAAFVELVERFYRRDGSVDVWNGSTAADRSWTSVRRGWRELAQEIPGARRAVRELARQVPTVVVANQPAECVAVLDDWGLTEVLRGIFLDSLEGVAKPDPGLLDLGRARLGRQPAEMLMVGNRVDHDVRPALALGCGAAFVRGDSAYQVPPGVHRDIVAAYERLRKVRTAPPPEDSVVMIVSSLADLVDRFARTEPTAPAQRAPGASERGARAHVGAPGGDTRSGRP